MARSIRLASGAATIAILAQSAVAFAADCFVDSVGGNDSNNASSEATAVKSIAKLPTSCTVIKFKRGSEFKVDKGVKNLGIPSMSGYTTSVTTLTNYGDAGQPLPKFIKDHVDGSGAMVEPIGAITIDGLYLSGSKSGSDMSQLGDGICVRLLGANSKLLNSEITLCDIGIMTSAENIQVLRNYVHDLSISVDAPPGVDPNAVGGAEGIFVNSSHVEVAYNRFVNCSTAAQWVTNTNGGGVRCDGGATEVSVPNGKNGAAGEVTDVRIHHNFSYNSCGFFEVASMFQQSSATYVKGKFTNSIFHDNVMVDSGWISLLQINNTRLTNVVWANNTIIHHNRPTVTDAAGTSIDMNDFGSSAIQVIAFNDTSSGATGGGEISPGDIFWKNNLWYFDPKVKPYSPHSATTTSSDQFVKNIQVTGDIVVTADPGFVDINSTTDPAAYDLKATATGVIDKGTNITEIASDYLDRPRPAGASFDLGAFEFQPSAGGASARGGATSTTTAQGGQIASGGTAAVSSGGQPEVSSSGGAGTVVGQGGSQGQSSPVPTAGTPQAALVGADPGGCSCELAGRPARGAAAVGLMALGALLLRRSRRTLRTSRSA